ILLGFSLGSSFGMALLFIGLRARDTDSANELSGMSQSAGYTLAATGPALFGALHDFTLDWTIPLGLLLFVSLIKLRAGWMAGRSGYV
ncbi:MAG: MFS transporter, partial [Balneolaceae bacterium]